MVAETEALERPAELAYAEAENVAYDALELATEWRRKEALAKKEAGFETWAVEGSAAPCAALAVAAAAVYVPRHEAANALSERALAAKAEADKWPEQVASGRVEPV